MPIVILHGWGSSSQSWAGVKKLLTEYGLQVLVPDLPGFGEASPPPKAWNLDDYTEWVKSFVDQHHLEQFFLVGHSFGGRIAVEFASRYPERLRGVIFIASAGVTPRKKWKVYIFYIITKTGNLIFSIPPLSIFKKLLRKIIYLLAHERDYYQARGVMRETMRNVVNYDLIPRLPHVRSPALIIWGSNDAMTPISDAHIFHKNIPGSELEIFEGGKHSLHLQMPKRLAQTIQKWVNSQTIDKS